ncbi:catechol 2,3-dioxygenase-like lactoylglutathione lyase family enzyme [Bacillus fengqiuensis]|nr:catechol 2,3-dioxygenase-like lactoylglutathione lyase family enzyme [Bacillus fengqiuensis]
MQILKLTLETKHINEMKTFYREALELPFIKETETFFTVQAGKTLITFQQSVHKPYYHFAFRTNFEFFHHMYEKLKMLALPDEDGETSLFWKGKQMYFNDPDGNMLEILERPCPYHDYTTGFYDVCEIGMPSDNIEEFNSFLTPLTDKIKSDSPTFRFFGDEMGVLVLAKQKRPWYPTNIGATIHPLMVEVAGEIDQVLKHPQLPYTVKIKKQWSEEFPAVQMRIARPTDKFEEIIQFYGEGLGLRKIGEFYGHDGFDGVMFGLPSLPYHLEFTRHVDGSPCPAPTKDNLLVFYMPDGDAIDRIITRLDTLGYTPVEPENPHWAHKGFTIEDPDGWRIVLFHSTGL